METKSVRIFLDDVREPEECSKYMHTRIGPANIEYLAEWVIVRTHKDFCKAIEEHFENITHVSFDHDLADCFQLKETSDIDAWYDVNGNREYTGYDSAKFLKEYYSEHKKQLPIMYVHSMNPVGAQRIIKLFLHK